MRNTKKMSTQTLVMGAVLTALVIVIQSMAAYIKFATPMAWALILIVIGTATCGKFIGAWLGLVFGVAILLTPGGADPFFTINPIATIIIVLIKGTMCGFLSGYVYEIYYKLSKKNIYLSTLSASIVCPIVNTAIFISGCFIFFFSDIQKLSGGNAIYTIFIVYAGLNFILELTLNIILAPVVVRILKAIKK